MSPSSQSSNEWQMTARVPAQFAGDLNELVSVEKSGSASHPRAHSGKLALKRYESVKPQSSLQVKCLFFVFLESVRILSDFLNEFSSCLSRLYIYTYVFSCFPAARVSRARSSRLRLMQQLASRWMTAFNASLPLLCKRARMLRHTKRALGTLCRVVMSRFSGLLMFTALVVTCFLSRRLYHDNHRSRAGALPARGRRVLWRGQHRDPRGGHRWARQVLRRRGRGHGDVSKHSLSSCSHSHC